ncbi:MAG: alpha-N-arabinofuranosidase [Anaerolineaceae bacterium]|nr:alpha-N-arabinofuranosidase [Anaerolineaceae bacterium]
MTSTILIDYDRSIGEIDPHIFGGFIEHMGRMVYEGIYDPESPLSDERGFRTDVLAALKELAPTVIRYPGGNMLSGYHWLDGVGAREKRPRKRDLAWQSIESNQFGLNEFMQYCQELKTEPMLGVNLGTGTIEEAAALVEYCNADSGSYYADLRQSHGIMEPYHVKKWCLGNEMDGPWQIGHLEADEYGRKAREAAKMMKWQDSSIQLILCGSSNKTMPTFPEWDRQVLETCWEHVDYLSMHHYANNNANDTTSYLALALEFESFIDTLEGTLRYVRAKQRSNHQVFLSWDEWNVWYKNMETQGTWCEAPHLIEEVYNLEDALVVAQWMNVFLRRCNVLKMACLAQLVNVIAPILTTPEGLLRQTIFYPFQLFSQFASGKSMEALCKSPLIETPEFGDVPLLDVSASFDETTRKGAVFIVNRSQNGSESVNIKWQGFEPLKTAHVYQLAGDNPKLINSFDHPHNVRTVDLGDMPVVDQNINIELPALSCTVIAV